MSVIFVFRDLKFQNKESSMIEKGNYGSQWEECLSWTGMRGMVCRFARGDQI